MKGKRYSFLLNNPHAIRSHCKQFCIGGCLGHFYFLVITNKAVLNTLALISFSNWLTSLFFHPSLLVCVCLFI